MAAVEPPPTIARVVDVQDPGGNFLVVYVRMPQHLANKFPDRPWGTLITDIGLAAKDVVRFEGYQLVDIEAISERRVGDSSDLFWVFQKLPGPVWTTLSQGQDSLIPAKYRRLVVTTKSKQEVAPDTQPSDIEPPLTQSIVEQQDDTGKAIKVDITEVIDINADPLTGEVTVSQFGGGVATTEESLVESDGVDSVAAEGMNILGSSKVPLGNGLSILQTTTLASPFPELSGQNYNPELGVDLPYIEQVVAAGTLPPLSDVSPIDKWRSKVRTPDISAIQAALDRIHYVLPTQESVQLPDQLRSVKVLVSRIKSDGNSFGSGNFSIGGSSSVSLSADFNYEIEEGFSGSAPAEIHVFFLPQENIASAILDKCNARSWPLYRPIGHRVVIAGHGISKRWQLSASDSGLSQSEDADITAFTSVGVIPATLHGGVSIEVEYADYTAPTAETDYYTDIFLDRVRAKWDLIEQACVIGRTVLGIAIVDEATRSRVLDYIDIMQSGVDFRKDLTAEDLTVTVSPESLSGTSHESLEAGRYIVRSNAQLYGYERVKVTAVVVDLSELI